MTDPRQLGFKQIWLVDFEFASTPGSLPAPHTLVAHEIYSGRTVRLFEEEFTRLKAPPYDIGPTSLFTAYYASAELGCHHVLGWADPEHVLDLFIEHRNLTNGLPTFAGNSLLGALTHYGIDAMDAVEKQNMQSLAARGVPFSAPERAALLDYCEQDVVALRKLLPVMLPRINLPYAIFRAKFMAAAARMENVGTPIDVQSLATLKDHWDGIKDGLITKIDRDYGVYDGRTFKDARFEEYVALHRIPWPRLPSGSLEMKDEVFKAMAMTYPQIEPLRQLRQTLSQMKLTNLAVGSDGRNRCLLSAFGAGTGRCTPSNAQFIFGLPSWTRGLIKPTEGMSLIYADWSAQEFGISAWLSKDRAMISAYESGDPYLWLAKRARVVPEDATKVTHGAIRERYKTAMGLGVGYGMWEDTLALRIGQSKFHARELLRQHHETFPQFWRWSDGILDRAMQRSELHTVFDWCIHYGAGKKINPRSIRNWVAQAHGAETLRLACILAIKYGIRVCCPVHDALVAECRTEDLKSTVKALQAAMAEASRIVLGGFTLRSEVKTISYPSRFEDPRGADMWNTIWDLIEDSEVGSSIAPTLAPPVITMPSTTMSSMLQGVSI
jgi:DNA polymerase-1